MHRKVIVSTAHIGDHYELTRAFHEHDLLLKLVTDLYLPMDQVWFSTAVTRFLGAETVSKRYHPDIGSKTVHVSSKALLYSFLARLTGNRRYNISKDQAVSRAARRQAAMHQDAPLLCYSYYAYEAFREGADRPSTRILWQVHPHPATVKRLLQEELALTPIAKNSLMQEPDIKLEGYQLERLAQEPTLANGWMAASTFTKQSLVENGVAADDIHVIPYGVDTSAFARREAPPTKDSLFTIVFVGQMIQRKGLSYLLDAVRLLKSQHIRLVLCGRGYADEALFAHYSDINVEIRRNLSFPDLLDQLHRSDIFVLPSLVEGFGHVIVEAMATGLPVIVTPNTGGADVITDGKEGFIVPVRSAQSIAEKLVWAIEHQENLAQMGEMAAKRASALTWANFRKGIANAYREIMISFDL